MTQVEQPHDDGVAYNFADSKDGEDPNSHGFSDRGAANLSYEYIETGGSDETVDRDETVSQTGFARNPQRRSMKEMGLPPPAFQEPPPN